jgi:HNH endonuclease
VADKGSSRRKSALLGMPHGTAANRLRKMILFHLLERHGENLCFGCGERIETVDELSIDHKQPWEGISVELFWLMENIAFSHRRCNVTHRKRGGGAKRRKVGPEGTAWCRRCKTFRSVADFCRHRARWNGLQAWCNEYINQHRQTKP